MSFDAARILRRSHINRVLVISDDSLSRIQGSIRGSSSEMSQNRLHQALMFANVFKVKSGSPSMSCSSWSNLPTALASEEQSPSVFRYRGNLPSSVSGMVPLCWPYNSSDLIINPAVIVFIVPSSRCQEMILRKQYEIGRAYSSGDLFSCHVITVAVR